jgi:ATP-dependent DNA helicase RecQ
MVSAVPYHAGLDAKNKSHHQDVLMEDVEVVVATIALDGNR